MKELVNGHGVVSEWGKRLGEGQRMKGIAGFGSRVPGRSCHGCNFRPLVSGRVAAVMKTISDRQRVLESKTSMVSMGFCIRLGIHFVQNLNKPLVKTCHDVAVIEERSTGSGNKPDQWRFAPGLLSLGQSADGNPFILCITYTCETQFSARVPGMNEIVSGLPGRLKDGSCSSKCGDWPKRRNFILCDFHTGGAFAPVILPAMNEWSNVLSHGPGRDRSLCALRTTHP